jgi:hypothetical protein
MDNVALGVIAGSLLPPVGLLAIIALVGLGLLVCITHFVCWLSPKQTTVTIRDNITGKLVVVDKPESLVSKSALKKRGLARMG